MQIKGTFSSQYSGIFFAWTMAVLKQCMLVKGNACMLLEDHLSLLSLILDNSSRLI